MKMSIVIWYDVDSHYAYNCIKSIIDNTVSHEISIFAVRTSHGVGNTFDSKIRWLPRTTLLQAPGATVCRALSAAYLSIKNNVINDGYIGFGTADFIVKSTGFLDDIYGRSKCFVPAQDESELQTSKEKKCLVFVPLGIADYIFNVSLNNFFILETMVEKASILGSPMFKMHKSVCKVSNIVVQQSILQSKTFQEDQKILINSRNRLRKL